MALEDWRPTVANVAAHIRARTRIEGGNEAGTFNESTRPTGAQADELIDSAQRSVLGRIGGIEPCNESMLEDGKGVVALRAAMLIEASFYPEQTRTDRSNFAQLKSLYDEDVKALAETVARVCGTTPGDEGAAGPSPVGHFDALPIIGRSTPSDW